MYWHKDYLGLCISNAVQFINDADVKAIDFFDSSQVLALRFKFDHVEAVGVNQIQFVNLSGGTNLSGFALETTEIVTFKIYGKMETSDIDIIEGTVNVDVTIDNPGLVEGELYEIDNLIISI